MGCLEEKLRQALRQDARQCLEELLNDPTVHVPGDQTQPGESCHAQRVNTIDSLFGPLTLRRNYYSPGDGSAGRVPLDESLGVVEGCTPGLARLMCRAGALEPYEDASQSLEVYCGITIEGPLPGDTVFVRAARGEFDAVIACYHDQGLIPVKLVAFGRAVNVTLGLPIIRTSVDHGTAYDIAGRGVADHSSLVEAVRLAARLAGGAG